MFAGTEGLRADLEAASLGREMVSGALLPVPLVGAAGPLCSSSQPGPPSQTLQKPCG